MRFVIYGAGAVGGLMGGSLFGEGHDVVLIARGANLRAVLECGLCIHTPRGTTTHAVPAVASVEEAGIGPADTVIVAVKGQDTLGVLDRLAACAPGEVAVVCAQNGVENERVALRRFARVYGACVSCNATYLEPGVVVGHGSPALGVVVLGRYPSGLDDRAAAVGGALTGAGWLVTTRPDVMRWKHAKLLRNLSNAVGAICGPEARGGTVVRLAREEALACYEAAGVDYVGEEEWGEDDKRSGQTRFRPAGGVDTAGGSSWQSLLRGAGSVESDYLNGEIVLLGREHGVPTPANALLARLSGEFARAGLQPGALSEEELLARLRA